MNILIIDDNELHQKSAKQTLGHHSLTIVNTYDDAYTLLQEPCVKHEDVVAEMINLGFEKEPENMHDDVGIEYLREYRRVKKDICPPPFDVVLTDLLMPASNMIMGSKGLQFIGQEMAVGFPLSLRAATHGAKYIAVLTDTDHHDHPASAMLDSLKAPGHKKARFDINGAKVGYYHSPMIPVNGSICPHCEGEGCYICGESGKRCGKNWAAVLEYLLDS